MTLSINIKKVVNQRIRELKEGRPDIDVHEEWLEDRAVLSVIQDNKTVECDFVESMRSCTQMHRMSEYYDVLGRGIMLGIIVPQDIVNGEIDRMKRIKGSSRYVILGYGEDTIISAKA